MTTIEANEILEAKYPGSEISTWDWVQRKGSKVEHNYSAQVDSYHFYGGSLEAAVAAVNAPGPIERAAEKRALAAKLEAEAEALESRAVEKTARPGDTLTSPMTAQEKAEASK